MANNVSWKEELALIVLLSIIVAAGILAYAGKISSENFTMIALSIAGTLGAVLGVRETKRETATTNEAGTGGGGT